MVVPMGATEDAAARRVIAACAPEDVALRVTVISPMGAS
jgi:hypothetical protein